MLSYHNAKHLSLIPVQVGQGHVTNTHSELNIFDILSVLVLNDNEETLKVIDKVTEVVLLGKFFIIHVHLM